MRLFCAVAVGLFAEGLLSSTSDSISKLGQHRIFFPWQVTIAVVRWGFCADYVVKFASPSCVRFIYFGFLLATTFGYGWYAPCTL